MAMEVLFYKRQLNEYLSDRLNKAKDAAAQVPQENIRADLDGVVASVVQRFEVERISIRQDDLAYETREGEVRIHGHDMFRRGSRDMTVQGSIIQLSVPFAGLADLLFLRPSTYDSSPPRARVQGQSIYIDIEVPQQDTNFSPRVEEAKRAFHRIGEYARWQDGELNSFATNLERTVRTALQNRVQATDAANSLLTQLGIPLKTRAGAPSLPIQLKQEVKVARRETKTASASQPSYRIAEQDYENILSLVRHQCLTFEEAPAAFRALEEEYLRDIIRAALSTVYSAGAETFRKKGKTDILIEQSSRAAFVAECKVWAGGKGLREALDQLLGYLTWRDCHAAILLFNKDVADFAGLLGKIPSEVSKHTSFLRQETTSVPNEWRFTLKLSDGHEIRCQVMIFNLCER